MIAPLFISLAILLILGVPVAFALGLASLISIMVSGELPITIIPQRMFVSLDSFPLLAVPFFILAGELMEKGGISHRLVRLVSTLIGHLKGGLAMVSVAVSIFFAGVSGSGTADVAAVGSVVIPAMKKEGYKPAFIAPLIAAGGALGPIIPPSVVLIIYGSMVGLSVGSLFLGGIIPGLLIGLGLMVVCYIYAVKEGLKPGKRSEFKEVIEAGKDAIWAIPAPLIIIGGIVFGIFTASEAGVIAVLYSFITGVLIYKGIKLKDLGGLIVSAAKTSASVMLILAVAGVFGWILGFVRFPIVLTEAINYLTNSPAMAMLITLVFLIFIGLFLEMSAVTIILIPILHAIAIKFGFNPIHFAVVVSMAIIIGGVTPPVGIFLFMSSSMAKVDLKDTIKYAVPIVAIMLVVLLLAAFIPNIILFLPTLFLG